LRYHAESLAALSGYRNLILDEFHLYSGVELAHALFMLHLGRSIGNFSRVLLLSATPAEGVAKYLNQVLDNPFIVDENTICKQEIVGEREAVQSVKVIPVLAGKDAVETAVSLVKDLRNQIRDLRQANSGETISQRWSS